MISYFKVQTSPSCSNFTLRHTAKENEDEIGSAVANTMRRNFYVDDCLRSVKTEADGKSQITCLRQACAKGGFRLTKFISNHQSVLESIPEEECSKEVKLLDLNYDDLPIKHALGVVCRIRYTRLPHYCQGQTPDQKRNTLQRILYL